MGFYRQCEDFKDVEKMVGAEAAVLFVDEAPQIKWDHLRMLAAVTAGAEDADGKRARIDDDRVRREPDRGID
jgi:hypothetical protein